MTGAARAAAGVLAAFVAAAACLLMPATASRAQTHPEPWRPAPVDSARLWANAANAVLSESTRDTITARDNEAFLLLDRIAFRHFARLGSRGMRGARSVLTELDSLGVQAEFAQDEQLPQFCALTFFNPKFAGYAALTYVYWWRGSDLMHQGIRLTGGRNLQLDVWWTGIELAPYEMALVDSRRAGNIRESFFTLLRLSRKADYWGIVQFGSKDVDLGGPGATRLMDLNGDGIPEIVNYAESTPDPRFVAGPYLPPLLSERVWEHTDDGFKILDRRTLAAPFATFVLFLRALEHGDFPLARDLTASPGVVQRAQALKLGTFGAPKSWSVLETPAGGPWNHVLRFGYGKPGAHSSGVEVTFKYGDGHWVIEKLEPAGSTAKPAPARAGTKR